jgi:hypothetical protein
LAGIYELGNEPSASKKCGEFPNLLNRYELLKKDIASYECNFQGFRDNCNPVVWIFSYIRMFKIPFLPMFHGALQILKSLKSYPAEELSLCKVDIDIY